MKFYECHGNITFLYFSNFFGVALYIHGSWLSYTFMINFLTDERWHTIDNNKWMIHEVIYIYEYMDYIYILHIYIISWFIIYGWLADQLVMSLAEWTVRWCSHWNLPNLVICYSSPWKITMLLIGKPSINGPFSMAMLNNQRGSSCIFAHVQPIFPWFSRELMVNRYTSRRQFFKFGLGVQAKAGVEGMCQKYMV